MSKLVAFLLAGLIFCGIIYTYNSFSSVDVSYLWGIVAGALVAWFVG